MTDGLDGLRVRFRERVAAEAGALRAWAATDLAFDAEVERMIHNLAGAAGTLGYADLHAAAARVDDAFAEGTTPSAASVETLLAEVERLIAIDG